MFQNDFREIGHCGGTLSIDISLLPNGSRSFALGFRHSSPRPAAFFMIYALQQGIPVATIPVVGWGEGMPEPPFPGCYPIIIGSDSEGRFGHQCNGCKGYWRSSGAPSNWQLTCPYCGIKGHTHSFVTDRQKSYVESFCELIWSALDEGKSTSIDMDVLAEKSDEKTTRSKFYYVEENQQTKFTCKDCGGWNDILGRFGYCSSCGTRNDIAEFEIDALSIREKINSGGPYEACVKEIVSAFDTVARKYSDELVRWVPLTNKRKARLKDKNFHNLRERSKDLEEVFGISIFDGLSNNDVVFANQMFERRHVYEHKGGEVDDAYLRNSGDTSVRVRERIKETQENSHRIVSLVSKMLKNLHESFHEIFPPESIPIEIQRELRNRLRR